MQIEINTKEAKVNSAVVSTLLKKMSFTPIDHFLISNYSANVYLGIGVGALLGGSISAWIGSALHLSSLFYYSFLIFGVLSVFFLFMFIYKALMMNLYLKIRREIKNIEEYGVFTKILMKNSYQIYTEDDIQHVLTAIEKDNSRAIAGERFGISNIFKINGDDKVLMAISSFNKKMLQGIELIK